MDKDFDELLNQIINNSDLIETLLKENKELMNTIKQVDNLIKIHTE